MSQNSDYQHHSERTLPRPIHGHISTPEPELSHRNGDIRVIRPDGTEYTMSSKDAAQIEYERSEEERRAAAVERQHPNTIKPDGYYGEIDKVFVEEPNQIDLDNLFGRD